MAGERGGTGETDGVLGDRVRGARVSCRRATRRGPRDTDSPACRTRGVVAQGLGTIYARHRQKRQCQNSDHTTHEAADSVARRARARTFAFFARDWTGDERTLPRVSPAQASLRDVNVHMVAISRTAPLRDLSALDEHTAAFDL